MAGTKKAQRNIKRASVKPRIRRNKLSLSVVFNIFYRIVSNLSFIVISGVGLYLDSNIAQIVKVLNKFAKSPIFKIVATYLITKKEKLPGVITILGYLFTNVSGKQLTVIVPIYLYLALNSSFNLPIAEDIILGVFITAFSRTRSIKIKITIIIIAIITLVLGMWGSNITDYFIKEENNNISPNDINKNSNNKNKV